MRHPKNIKIMNMKILILLFPFLFIPTSFSQENKIGAMKTQKGTLLYYNLESPFTIDIEGNVNLEQFPFIDVDNKLFQFVQNTIQKNANELKQNLEAYMKWELDYLNDLLPEKVEIISEFIEINHDTLNFWYFKNPIIKDAPKDIKPCKMTFYLDWKKEDNMYRLVFPSFSEDSDEAKQFLLKLKNNFKYYSKEINLEKLYNNVSEGHNFYDE